MKFIVLLVCVLVATVSFVLGKPSATEIEASKDDQSWESPLNELLGEKRFSDFVGSPSAANSPNSTSQKYFKKWSEKSFTRAIRNLGILKIPGLKLVKLPISMIQSLKRMPDHVMLRPTRYIQPLFNPQYDASNGQCKEDLHNMYVLAHADQRIAYQVQTLTCQGACGVEICSLRKKTMVVYLINQSRQLEPKTIQVGCACVCA